MHRNSLPFFLSILQILLTLGPLSAGKKKTTYNFKPAHAPMLSITKEESQHHVNILASSEFAGRGTGTPGQWLAAKYIASEFSKYGLVPVGHEGKYYQKFQVIKPDLKSTSFSIQKNRSTIEFSVKSDFIPFSFSGENKVNAAVVFAGYGITAPEYGYDDYKSIAVKGKIVLVLRHEPQENDPESIFDGTELTRHALFEEKTENAKRHGAAGILLVTDPNGHHGSMSPHGSWNSLYPARNIKKRWQLEALKTELQFPAVWISGKVAEKILMETGYSLASLQTSIDKLFKPKSFTIPQLKIKIAVTLKKEVQKTQNVVGFLPGADPRLLDEIIVIGAHYDHVGMKNGRIFYGADDNASGTAGLLEIAEAFSNMSTRPRRSILFVAFSAEELGLLGSKFYVENPVKPLNKTVAMINLDMISRNRANKVTVIGSNRSRELHEINIAANDEIGLDLVYNGERYFSRSDQANFAKYKIPVIFYNTDAHRDYHRPTDTAEKIDAEKLARVARLAFLVAWEIANSNTRPTYGRFKTPLD